MNGSALSSELVTVLIPVYNARNYLEEAIESVLKQTYQFMEIVVIDDGSTDDSPEILSRLAAKDSRISVVRKPNGGISSALNTGLDLARGDLIARMDADDLMMPHRIATQHAYLRANPALGFCASYMRVIDGAGRFVRSYAPAPVTHAALAAQIARREAITYTHPAVMFRTAVARNLGGYNRELEPCEDTDLFGRMITSGMPGLVIPEELLSYRLHSGSISGSKTKSQVEMLEHVRHNFYMRLEGRPEINLADRPKFIREMPLVRRALYQSEILSQTLRQLASYDRASGRHVRGLLRLGAAAVLKPHKAVSRLVRSLQVTPAKAA